MIQWSIKRRISFAIHAVVVAIPFGFSTASAFLFWQSLFGSGWIAAPMVAVIDVLALLGLILYIARIESPFVHLRHALPFISIVPLGLELYSLLAHNAAWVQWVVTLTVSSILVAVAWQCFTTIERLFIPPLDAAREKAREQMEGVRVQLARLEEMQTVADEFARDRMQYHAPLTFARIAEQPAYPAPAPARIDAPPESMNADEQVCPNCGAHIDSKPAWLAARRWKRCAACKEG